MRAIVFLDTSKSGSSREAIQAARGMGYMTVVWTPKPKLLQQRSEFWDIDMLMLVDLTDLEQVDKAYRQLRHKGIRISLITSFVDPYVSLAAAISERFGIKTLISFSEANRMEDKVQTRMRLKETPYGPFFHILHSMDEVDAAVEAFSAHLPLMVKSPGSTGSKDVLCARTSHELKQSLQSLLRKYRSTPVLLEQYLDGPQTLVELMVMNGNAHVIAIVEQEITAGERFIVTGYRVVRDVRQEKYAPLRAAVEGVLRALGFNQGPCHLELRNVNGQWKLIEANPRISGGAMNRMIWHAKGIDLVAETLRFCLGEAPDLTMPRDRAVFTQYVTIRERGVLEKVTGKQRALQQPNVLEVYVKPRKGSKLSPPLSMGDRYAYIIADGQTEEEAREHARQAAKLIRFHLMPI